MLLVGQRDAGHVGAGDLGKVQAQPAPAAADVEHAQVSFMAVAAEQQFGGEVPFLGELGVVERLLGAVEIAAAVLPVGVEEQRIEPAVEIVMMRHVVARAPARIELLQAAVKVTQQPLRPRPVRHVGILAEHYGEHVGDRAALDHEGPVHIGFAEFEFGIEENSPLGAAGAKAHPYRLAGPIAEG